MNEKIWKILSWVLGTKFLNFFVHILGNTTTSYFRFEIYWPLVHSNIVTYLIWFEYGLEKKWVIEGRVPKEPDFIFWNCPLPEKNNEENLHKYLQKIVRGCQNTMVYKFCQWLPFMLRKSWFQKAPLARQVGSELDFDQIEFGSKNILTFLCVPAKIVKK